MDEDLVHIDRDGSERNSLSSSRSFLESENYEQELGGPSESGEDFSDLMKYEIVEVIGEGDLAGRPFIMIYAYRLPPTKGFDHQKLLRFLQHTLDKVVDMDYTIIYFHYGLKSNNKPSIKWLIQAYQALDRRYKKNLKALYLVHPTKYKKNLKALYLVHPTKFIKVLWSIFKPFISYKFERKMHYCNFIDDLGVVIRTENLNVPRPILEYDISLKSSSKVTPSRAQPKTSPLPTHQFCVPLDFILKHHPGAEIPPIVDELLSFLRQYGMETEGIFRRSAELLAINRLQERINSGIFSLRSAELLAINRLQERINSGIFSLFFQSSYYYVLCEKIDFLSDAEYHGNLPKAVIHASVLLKTFLRSMGEPIITNRLYPQVLVVSELNDSDDKIHGIRELFQNLPTENYVLLRTILKFLTEVASHSDKNLMNPNNLSIVFGPNLTWPTDQQVPLAQINKLNSFCLTMIVHYEEIFCA
uniref:Rho GTPase-activating protein 1 n=1 Tax=Acrobeloides nanus TaxID=290746 RepID=A0A914CNY4_9BILA